MQVPTVKNYVTIPNHLGNRHERVRGSDRYYDFIDQFVQTAERLFPKLYLHWEDFGQL